MADDGAPKGLAGAAPAALVEALQVVVSMIPQGPGQRTLHREIIGALGSALDARRQRIIVSEALHPAGHMRLLVDRIRSLWQSVGIGDRDGAFRNRSGGLGAASRCTLSTVHRSNLHRPRAASTNHAGEADGPMTVNSRKV